MGKSRWMASNDGTDGFLLCKTVFAVQLCDATSFSIYIATASPSTVASLHLMPPTPKPQRARKLGRVSVAQHKALLVCWSRDKFRNIRCTHHFILETDAATSIAAINSRAAINTSPDIVTAPAPTAAFRRRLRGVKGRFAQFTREQVDNGTFIHVMIMRSYTLLV